MKLQQNKWCIKGGEKVQINTSSHGGHLKVLHLFETVVIHFPDAFS